MICYLDCSQNDCCHNKGGACCLGGVKVHHAGQSDAVCRSYRNNEAYANAATDNAPPSAETAVRCDDTGCRHNAAYRCRAPHVHIEESGCGPRCVSRIEK